MSKWKKITSNEIFVHPRIVLIEDEIMLPNGVKTSYLKFKNTQNSATIICKRKDGKIILQKQYSYPPDMELYEFPGGGVPFEENLEIGANRELMEECGFRAGHMTLIGKYLMNNRRSNQYMYVYLAEELTEEKAIGDIEEDITIYWLSKEEINELIKNGEVINYSVLAAWALYKESMFY